MTTRTCIGMCQKFGKQYAGLQDGNKCICFDDLPSGAMDNSECNILCHGDHDDICGGQFDRPLLPDKYQTSVYDGKSLVEQ